jgi:hypothetical protein
MCGIVGIISKNRIDENDIVFDVRTYDITNPDNDFTGVERMNSLTEEDRTLIGKRYNGETCEYEVVQ